MTAATQSTKPGSAYAPRAVGDTVSITALTAENPTRCTVSEEDGGKIANGDTLILDGFTDPLTDKNGSLGIVAGLELTTFQLEGVDLSGAEVEGVTATATVQETATPPAPSPSPSPPPDNGGGGAPVNGDPNSPDITTAAGYFPSPGIGQMPVQPHPWATQQPVSVSLAARKGPPGTKDAHEAPDDNTPPPPPPYPLGNPETEKLRPRDTRNANAPATEHIDQNAPEHYKPRDNPVVNKNVSAETLEAGQKRSIEAARKQREESDAERDNEEGIKTQGKPVTQPKGSTGSGPGSPDSPSSKRSAAPGVMTADDVVQSKGTTSTGKRK